MSNSVCCMSNCSIFISFFFLWHCINVISKIPGNSQYGTIQSIYIDFLKVKTCFADTEVNYNQRNTNAFKFKITLFTVDPVNMWLTTWKTKQNKKKTTNKTHKTGEINKTVNLYLETDVEVTACLLRQMAVTWPQHFLSLSIDILRQLVHLHQFVLVDGDGSEW